MTDKLIVFVSCSPLKGPLKEQMQDFSTYLAPLAERTAEAKKKLHYKMIDYGAGPGMLAALVKHENPKGVFRVERYSTEAAVLDMLMSMADEVYG